MAEGEVIRDAIQKALRFSRRGMTVTDISHAIHHNRNLTAKELEILQAEGKVDVRKVGSARVFSLAQRVPLSAFLCFTRNMIVILDQNMAIVQANDQYAGLTGLSKQELIGRNIVEGSYPIISDPDALGVIQSTEREQVITDIRFQKGKEALFYSMQVIPTTFEDGKTGLTVVLEDVTEKKHHLRDMEFLARTAMELVDLPPETDIYRYIAERLRELLPGDPMLYIHSYDEVKREFFMRALENDAVRTGAAEMAGYDLVGMTFPIENFFYAAPFFETPATFKTMREMHFRPLCPDEEISFYDSCARIFTQEVCDTFLRSFHIGKIYLTGLVWQDRLFGLVGIFQGPDETLENRQAIESFLRQASIALARRTTEERLSRSEQNFADLVAYDDRPSLVLHNDGRTMFVNPRFTEIFGYTQRDIPTWEIWVDKACTNIGYRSQVVAIIHPDRPGPGRGPELALPVRCSNGEEKDVVIQPVYLSDGVVITIHLKDLKY